MLRFADASSENPPVSEHEKRRHLSETPSSENLDVRGSGLFFLLPKKAYITFRRLLTGELWKKKKRKVRMKE